MGDDEIELEEVEAVLKRIQRFDPVGVAAKDLRDCLLIQLSQFSKETPWLEEARAIIPAIEQAQAEGTNVDGPVPPDTVFVKAQAGQYGIVVAMYHDQGHIPLKLAGFKLDLKTNKYTAMSGVNSTIGLPIIRTSVDHGTAFGKAGEGRANEESLVDAMDMAILMAKNRKNVTK